MSLEHTAHICRRFVLCALLISICLGVFLLSPPMARGEEDKMLKEQIFDAWKKRQKMVSSGRFYYTLGKAEIELSFDGDRKRYHFQGVNPFNAEGVKQDHTSTFNGKESKFLELVEREVPIGFYFNEGYCRRAVLIDSLVLRFTFRAFRHERSGFDCSTLAISSRSGSIDGQKCVILERITLGIGGMDIQEYFWVDPTKGYSIVRYQLEQGILMRQIDIVYENDKDKLLWIPKDWTYNMFNPDGTIKQTVESKLVKYELNPKLKDTDFEIEFPPNTQVNDLRLPRANK